MIKKKEEKKKREKKMEHYQNQLLYKLATEGNSDSFKKILEMKGISSISEDIRKDLFSIIPKKQSDKIKFDKKTQNNIKYIPRDLYDIKVKGENLYCYPRTGIDINEFEKEWGEHIIKISAPSPTAPQSSTKTAKFETLKERGKTGKKKKGEESAPEIISSKFEEKLSYFDSTELESFLKILKNSENFAEEGSFDDLYIKDFIKNKELLIKNHKEQVDFFNKKIHLLKASPSEKKKILSALETLKYIDTDKNVDKNFTTSNMLSAISAKVIHRIMDIMKREHKDEYEKAAKYFDETNKKRQKAKGFVAETEMDNTLIMIVENLIKGLPFILQEFTPKLFNLGKNPSEEDKIEMEEFQEVIFGDTDNLWNLYVPQLKREFINHFHTRKDTDVQDCENQWKVLERFLLIAREKMDFLEKNDLESLNELYEKHIKKHVGIPMDKEEMEEMRRQKKERENIKKKRYLKIGNIFLVILYGLMAGIMYGSLSKMGGDITEPTEKFVTEKFINPIRPEINGIFMTLNGFNEVLSSKKSIGKFVSEIMPLFSTSTPLSLIEREKNRREFDIKFIPDKVIDMLSSKYPKETSMDFKKLTELINEDLGNRFYFIFQESFENIKEESTLRIPLIGKFFKKLTSRQLTYNSTDPAFSLFINHNENEFTIFKESLPITKPEHYKQSIYKLIINYAKRYEKEHNININFTPEQFDRFAISATRKILELTSRYEDMEKIKISLIGIDADMVTNETFSHIKESILSFYDNPLKTDLVDKIITNTTTIPTGQIPKFNKTSAEEIHKFNFLSYLYEKINFSNCYLCEEFIKAPESWGILNAILSLPYHLTRTMIKFLDSGWSLFESVFYAKNRFSSLPPISGVNHIVNSFSSLVILDFVFDIVNTALNFLEFEFFPSWPILNGLNYGFYFYAGHTRLSMSLSNILALSSAVFGVFQVFLSFSNIGKFTSLLTMYMIFDKGMFGQYGTLFKGSISILVPSVLSFLTIERMYREEDSYYDLIRKIYDPSGITKYNPAMTLFYSTIITASTYALRGLPNIVSSVTNLARSISNIDMKKLELKHKKEKEKMELAFKTGSKLWDIFSSFSYREGFNLWLTRKSTFSKVDILYRKLFPISIGDIGKKDFKNEKEKEDHIKFLIFKQILPDIESFYIYGQYSVFESIFLSNILNLYKVPIDPNFKRKHILMMISLSFLINIEWIQAKREVKKESKKYKFDIKFHRNENTTKYKNLNEMAREFKVENSVSTPQLKLRTISVLNSVFGIFADLMPLDNLIKTVPEIIENEPKKFVMEYNISNLRKVGSVIAIILLGISSMHDKGREFIEYFTFQQKNLDHINIYDIIQNFKNHKLYDLSKIKHFEIISETEVFNTMIVNRNPDIIPFPQKFRNLLGYFLESIFYNERQFVISMEPKLDIKFHGKFLTEIVQFLQNILGRNFYTEFIENLMFIEESEKRRIIIHTSDIIDFFLNFNRNDKNYIDFYNLIYKRKPIESGREIIPFGLNHLFGPYKLYLQRYNELLLSLEETERKI